MPGLVMYAVALGESWLRATRHVANRDALRLEIASLDEVLDHARGQAFAQIPYASSTLELRSLADDNVLYDLAGALLSDDPPVVEAILDDLTELARLPAGRLPDIFEAYRAALVAAARPDDEMARPDSEQAVSPLAAVDPVPIESLRMASTSLAATRRPHSQSGLAPLLAGSERRWLRRAPPRTDGGAPRCGHAPGAGRAGGKVAASLFVHRGPAACLAIKASSVWDRYARFLDVSGFSRTPPTAELIQRQVADLKAQLGRTRKLLAPDVLATVRFARSAALALVMSHVNPVPGDAQAMATLVDMDDVCGLPSADLPLFQAILDV
ncbi:hypothetical protein K488DRAFT_92709, partial [Vararia minispora EC-137]